MNSRKAGEEKLGYLEGSLQLLLDALVRKLEEWKVEMVSAAPVMELEIEDQELFAVRTTKGEFRGGKFIFTIPTPYLVPMLKPHSPSYALQLDQVEYFGAVCVILEMKNRLSDIYWLNIAEKGFPFGGVIEHTNFISPHHYSGRHIAYLSRYFAHDEPIARMDEAAIASLMLDRLPDIYPEFEESSIEKVHVFKTQTAATVCDLNFFQKVPSFKTPIDQMYLVNMSHIYPDERSVNNSIRIAAEACKALGIGGKEVSEGSSLSGMIGF